MLTKADKGGGGGSQKLTFADRGGGGVYEPPFLADVIWKREKGKCRANYIFIHYTLHIVHFTICFYFCTHLSVETFTDCLSAAAAMQQHYK